jgi:hypothetical protein
MLTAATLGTAADAAAATAATAAAAAPARRCADPSTAAAAAARLAASRAAAASAAAAVTTTAAAAAVTTAASPLCGAMRASPSASATADRRAAAKRSQSAHTLVKRRQFSKDRALLCAALLIVAFIGFVTNNITNNITNIITVDVGGVVAVALNGAYVHLTTPLTTPHVGRCDASSPPPPPPTPTTSAATSGVFAESSTSMAAPLLATPSSVLSKGQNMLNAGQYCDTAVVVQPSITAHRSRATGRVFAGSLTARLSDQNHIVGGIVTTGVSNKGTQATSM